MEAIGHVLRDQPLAVPLYQRAYSWKAQQVEELWNDLRAALTLSEPEYFLGTIVIAPGDEGREIVIDGQQRLATVTLVLTAIRDAMVEAGDSARAKVLESQYLATSPLRTAIVEPKLQLTPDDDSYFRTLVLGSDAPSSSAVSSHERIRDALVFLKKAVAEEIAVAGPHWATRLFDWIEFLENNALVIVVRVPSTTDAFLIFETMNDRGLELTLADLTKNYLLGLAKDSMAEVQSQWGEIITELETNAEEEVFNDFLRHYWSSLYGATRERELLVQVKRRVNSAPHAVDLVAALNGAAPLYSALQSADHRWWSESGVDDRPLVETLLGFGLLQNRPLLLAAMETLGGPDLHRLLSALVGWSVRGLIVGGIGGGTTERYYATAATELRRSRGASASAVFEVLEPIIPTDEVFRPVFTTRRVNRTALARYYLTAIEQAMQGVPSPAIVGTAVDRELDLEFLLPRRAHASDWPGFPSDELGGWALRLGNQVLVPSGLAVSSARNWSERQQRLVATDRPLAEKAGRKSEWTSWRVDEAQAEMAGFALHIWPREP